MRTVSVIGASGFLGARICAHLRARATDRLAVVGAGCSRPPDGGVRLDVTDREALAAHLDRGFDFVLYLAGAKDVKRCEQEPGWARAVNADPVAEIARIVRRAGLETRLLYLSSDYVFDGGRGLYRDDEPPAPATSYGRSKVLGEEAALSGGGANKVVRSGAVLGRGGTFFDWLVGALRAPGEVRLFADAHFSPTPAELLAELVLELVDRWDETPERILHFSGDRRMSRLELGRLIAGLVPGVAARVVPDAAAHGGALFQRDLSLVASRFVAARPRPAIEECLRREVVRC
jgi:dTDP-4-dehydrorhamnose reductase